MSAAPILQINPFPHFIISNALREDVAGALLVWFKTKARWRRRQLKGYYDMYDADLSEGTSADVVSFFTSRGLHQLLINLMERTFDVELGEAVDVSAHKLLPGQLIKIHTDFGPQEQAFRLLFSVNDGWNVGSGGYLMLFDEEYPSRLTEAHRVYAPHHRTAFGFSILPGAFHAVSVVNLGERYTLLYSFYLRR